MRLRIQSVPAILVALPLVAVGALGLRAVHTEQATLHAQQRALAAQSLQSVESRLEATLDRAGEEAIHQVSRLDPPTRQDELSTLIRRAGLELVTVHEAGRRLFPPEGGVALFWPEQQRLQALDSLLITLRRDAERTSSSTGNGILLRVGDDLRYSFAQCRVIGVQTVCVALGPDRIEARLQEALAQFQGPSGPGSPALILQSPEGRVLPPSGVTSMPVGAERQALSGRFHGWQIVDTRPSTASNRQIPWAVAVAIIAPLLVSWLVLAWAFHRGQTETVRRATRRAEEAAQLSHELRTPLANLRLYTDLVLQEAGESGPVVNYCQVMESEIRRLSRLADAAVGSAAGRPPPVHHHEEAVPDTLLRTLVDRLQPLVLAAGCRTQVLGGAGMPCRFDLPAFERIVVNLLDNACKFSGGGSVQLRTQIAGALFCLSVRDEGPGVPEGAESLVFDPLARAEGVHEIEGFGLGLASVRALARAHGGDAWVENAHPGACFTVTLQVAQVSSASTSP